MQTAEGLKRQIETAEDLATVVRTMKTLAAVNIRQYEAAAASLEEYDRTLRMAVRMLIWNEPRLLQSSTRSGGLHPPLAERTGLIVFGSDQGMCGGFNDALADSAGRQLDEGAADPSVPIIVLGERLAARLMEAGRPVDAGIELPGSASGIALMLQELLPRIDRWREEHALGSVVLAHSRRLSQTLYEPVCRTLLPISLDELVPDRPRRWSGRSLPLVTMPARRLWRSLARQHLFVSLFQACAESKSSENAARIAAMQAAETHIHDRLEELNHDYQQLRQTSITEELLDVISGFEALITS